MGGWMDGQRDGSATHCCEHMEGYKERDSDNDRCVEKKDGWMDGSTTHCCDSADGRIHGEGCATTR